MPKNTPKEFVRPADLLELEALLKSTDAAAILYLAGGTDLVLDVNERQLPPCDLLIYLDGLAELKEISVTADQLLIGSGVTHEALAASPQVRALFPALVQAASEMGSPPIRVMATVGGNIARSSPAGDVATALLLTNAQLHLLGPEGRRTIPYETFHLSPRRNVLRRGEVITQIEIPLPQRPCGSAFIKLGPRKTMFIASVSCGAFLRLDPKSGAIAEARVCHGSIAPTPVRIPQAEALLVGQQPTEELLERAAEAAREQAHPRTSHRGTSAYRKEMAGVLTLRCLCRALETAREEVAER